MIGFSSAVCCHQSEWNSKYRNHTFLDSRSNNWIYLMLLETLETLNFHIVNVDTIPAHFAVYENLSFTTGSRTNLKFCL